MRHSIRKPVRRTNNETYFLLLLEIRFRIIKWYHITICIWVFYSYNFTNQAWEWAQKLPTRSELYRFSSNQSHIQNAQFLQMGRVTRRGFPQYCTNASYMNCQLAAQYCGLGSMQKQMPWKVVMTPSLPEFKKHLDNAPRHMMCFLQN